MTVISAYKRLTGVAIVSVMIGGLACVQTYNVEQVSGAWECTTAWDWEKEGAEPVPCRYESKASCIDNKLSMSAVLSIGDAQWDETIEGTCRLVGDELHSTKNAAQIAPKNDATRQFQQDELKGQPLGLGNADPNQIHRARITSVTETQLVVVNDEGRVTTCRRP